MMTETTQGRGRTIALILGVACIFALAGDHEKALDLLEHSISNVSWIENDPELDSIRDHPRYLAYIEKLRKQ